MVSPHCCFAGGVNFLQGEGSALIHRRKMTCFCHLCDTVSGKVNSLNFHCEQVVNRIKIPQGLSTLLFRRWSEVPSRGGVRAVSPQEKDPLFYPVSLHLCVTVSGKVNSLNCHRKRVVNRLKIPGSFHTFVSSVE